MRDDETSIADWDQVTVHTPEPVDNPPAFAAGVEFLKNMAPQARVFLYGEGPDNALRYEWRPYLSHLVAGRRGVHLLRALSNDLLMHPRVPLWSSIRQLAGARGHASPVAGNVPGLAQRRIRRHVVAAESDGTSGNECRPRRTLSGPWGTTASAPFNGSPLFDDCDITGALSHAEIRHPFLDLRLLQYMLALPAMPWCRNKLIIRRSMRAALPRDVLRRKKTALHGEPGFPAGPGLRIAPAGAIAGSAEIREPGQDPSAAQDRARSCVPRCDRSV